MEKDTKLGVNIGLVGFVCFITAYFSLQGSVILFALLLIFAESKKLKINASSSLIFALIIKLVTELLYIISDKIYGFLDWIRSFSDDYDFVTVMSNIIKWSNQFDLLSFIKNIILLAFFIMTIIFALKAAKGDIVKVPFVQKSINNAFDYSEE